MGSNYQGGPGPTGGGASGLAPNVAAGLAYLFGIIGGVVILLLERRDGFVRFCAIQSILLTAVCVGFWVAYGIIMAVIALIPGVRLLLILLGPLSLLLLLGFFVLWLVLVVRAFQGQVLRLPVIGDLAARYSNG